VLWRPKSGDAHPEQKKPSTWINSTGGRTLRFLEGNKGASNTLFNKLKASSPSYFDINNMEDNQCDVWDMTNRLLEKDFKPA
jgi:hypothetical protein